MRKIVIRVFIFLIVIVSAFMWVGYSVTKMTGGEKKATGGAITISPEAGEAIYWGKGSCYTCHSVGDRGSAVRGPNHGVLAGKFSQGMGARAVERAKERQKQTGKPYTATDYLVESLADPGAYIVEGYNNVMPYVYKPPMSLNTDEIKALVAYLQSQGGEVDLDAINKPTEISKPLWDKIVAASSGGGEAAPAGGELIATGDEPVNEIFTKATCVVCHTIPGIEGAEGQMGPKLTLKTNGPRRIKDANYKGKATSTREYIMESIIYPGAYVVPGYPDGVMPQDFGKKLTAKALDKTIDYLSQLEEGKQPPKIQ